MGILDALQPKASNDLRNLEYAFLIAAAVLAILLIIAFALPQLSPKAPSLRFNRTIQVTPDKDFNTGSFARINYVPSTNRFAVTFGTKGSKVGGHCNGTGYAYKEFTTDMVYTGKSGFLIAFPPDSCEAGDSGSVMVGNDYYIVTFSTEHSNELVITKFNASDWSVLAKTPMPLDDSHESGSDPCVAFFNGQLDVSDQYNAEDIWQEGYSSFHNFYSPDLQYLRKMILSDSPHISGASMIFADNNYYIISATSYDGGLVVLRYDRNWNYLGAKNITEDANWAQGVAFDGEHFYLAYHDTSIRTNPGFFPVYPNIHLAVLDRDWNILQDIAVTNFTVSDNRKAGRPWIMLYGNNVYVSYDVDTVDPVTLEEDLDWQAYVSIYEIERGR